jgi:adenylate cyclase
MAEQPTPDALTPVTVLFVDISGSTTLYAQRGDAAAFGLTKACLDLMREQITTAGGRVLRQVGDGVLAIFETPVEGLRAAIDTIAAIEDPGRTLSREGVRVRGGLSYGPAVLLADDVYGDVANVAARLVSRAAAGEIFLSGNVYDALPDEVRAHVQLIDQMLLRNRPTAVSVYKYVPDSIRATMKAGTRRLPVTATMEVTHGERLFVIGPERPRVCMGRDPGNDIRIDEDFVSRQHAEIALHGDRFVLVDRSTNGTYVYADQGPVFRLVREELDLTGAGRIVLGVAEAPAAILYRVTPR